uniref:Uncharacterized protein n=1 Tax=Aegilops tauschii subsp. strangulata TaxID=200361 RepID=A0A453MUR3_AEGTS
MTAYNGARCVIRFCKLEVMKLHLLFPVEYLSPLHPHIGAIFYQYNKQDTVFLTSFRCDQHNLLDITYPKFSISKVVDLEFHSRG